jgi:hypothetical protein
MVNPGRLWSETVGKNRHRRTALLLRQMRESQSHFFASPLWFDEFDGPILIELLELELERLRRQHPEWSDSLDQVYGMK